MVTEAREVRQQIEQTTFFAPESVGKFLFPLEQDKIHLIDELTPKPPQDKLLMILRVGPVETPVRGLLLGLGKKPLEELGREGGDMDDVLQVCLEDLNVSKRKLGGVMVFVDKGISLELIEDDLEKMIDQLYFATRIWLLEPDLIRASKEERKLKTDLMRRVGLVDRKSVSARGGFCFSTGRLAKKGERGPVDLTAPNWFEPVLRRVIKEYEESGWKVISTSGARENLKESTFVPDDISRLKLGFGVEIEAPCGCLWRVDFKNGAWEREKRCNDEGCKGYPPPKPKPGGKPVVTEKR